MLRLLPANISRLSKEVRYISILTELLLRLFTLFETLYNLLGELAILKTIMETVLTNVWWPWRINC